MRTICTLMILATLAIGCSSSQKSDKGLTRFEKLMKEYQSKPNDTALLRSITTEHENMQQQYRQEIADLTLRNTPEAWEQIANVYERMNKLRSFVMQDNKLFRLLNPQDHFTDAADARLKAADAYYVQAQELLNQRHWKEAREAARKLRKVKDLASSNYKDLVQLNKTAKELGTVDIVVEQLTSQGFFYNNSGFDNITYRFVDQLVNDMGGEYNSNGMYRIYSYDRYYRRSRTPDWTAQPVWTNLDIQPIRYNTTRRTVSRDIQVGSDTAGKPIYRNVRAELSITEATLNASGTLEMRVFDNEDRSSIARRSFNNSYAWKQQYATYTGDIQALSNDERLMVQRQRDPEPRQEWVQGQLLQKIYPDLLNWFRNVAGY